ITMEGFSNAPATHGQMKEISVIENGSLLAENGKIVAVGNAGELERSHSDIIQDAKVIDASGKIVAPGLVDPHTHLVHAGTRENEYAMRLKGKTYMEIMNAGGGIHATTRATQAASFDQLYKESERRMDTVLRHGVTTIEAKSGYGLTLEHELKQLEVAKQLNESHPLDIVSTFMGAHAIPMENKNDPELFVDLVIKEMFPVVAEKKLAVFNDVF